jgi:hypothetical protein
MFGKPDGASSFVPAAWSEVPINAATTMAVPSDARRVSGKQRMAGKTCHFRMELKHNPKTRIWVGPFRWFNGALDTSVSQFRQLCVDSYVFFL